MRLSYSGIFGSKLAASSPKRFAGICALLRLWVPRSPPFAFIPLTFFENSYFLTYRVDATGFEPATPALQRQCSTN